MAVRKLRGSLTPAHLTSRNQELAVTRKAANGRGGSSSKGGCQEPPCRQLYKGTRPWWDDRQRKKSVRFQIGFPHLESLEVLQVDVQMANLGVERGRCASPVPKWSVSDDDTGARGPAGYGMGMTAESVSKLCQRGQLTEAIQALEALVHTDYCISKSVFYRVIKECAAKKNLLLGRCVHALSMKAGYGSDTFLCNHILRMYASHGRLQEAVDVFNVVTEPDAFTWSAIISAHVQYGQDKQAIELYRRMRMSSTKPDGHVFVAALQACAKGSDLKSGQLVHADVLATSVQPSMFVWNCLVDMYAKCGSLEDAQRVFDGLRKKDVVTWSAMIAGYSQQGMGQEALHLYRVMQEEGTVAPNSVTFVCLLQACASVGSPALEKGRQLHAQIRELGLQGHENLSSSLVNMYVKCGSLEDSRTVFGELVQKDVVTWSTMITGYSRHGMGQEALSLYSSMQEGGICVPDSVTFLCLLQACASVGTPALEKGKQLHAQIREQGLQDNEAVASALVHMYAKCGSLEDAKGVFDLLGQKNVVTWTALIAGYSQQGMGQEAVRLYLAMQEEGMAVPDSVTFACLLQACANVAALHLGKQLHEQVRAQGLEADEVVASSLINMYGKCGSMVDAQQVFDALPKTNGVTWTALIAGYTSQGHSEKVFQLVQRMSEEGVQPDRVTFLSVLTVCSHTGLVAKGREYFEAMSKQHGITPTVDHYTCMVDLLGRAGQLDETLALVRTMPVLPNTSVWHALLGACRKWGNVEVGRQAFNEAVKLDKKDAAAYVLLSNIYFGAQMWEKARDTQARRKEIGAWKQPGQSWWADMDGLVHGFLVAG